MGFENPTFSEGTPNNTDRVSETANETLSRLDQEVLDTLSDTGSIDDVRGITAILVEQNPDIQKYFSSFQAANDTKLEQALLGSIEGSIPESSESQEQEDTITEAQEFLYEYLGIDENHDHNGVMINFSKGIIDTLIFENAELAAQVIETKGAVILDALEQLATWEGLKQLCEALGETISDLFVGDAYEKGKSVADLGLIATGVGVTATIGKKAFKTMIKKGETQKIHNFEELLKNDIAQLPDMERLEVASTFLGKSLNKTQQDAILTAHNIGSRSPDGNYSLGDLREKVHILQDAGFDSSEIRLLFDKNICGKEYPSFKNIYEDPRYEFLQQYSDVLGEKIGISNIMGEGVNAIVLKHPTEGIVMKIRKPGMDIDDIGYEIKNHSKVKSILAKGIEEGIISSNIKVPRILRTDSGYLKTYFVMEKIEGQTLSTQIFRNEHHGLKLQSSEFLDTLTDREIIQLMMDKYGSSTESLKKLREQHARSYLDDGVNSPGSKLHTALEYMKNNGIEHTDLHTGNIMIDNNEKIYIIDFGRVNNTL